MKPVFGSFLGLTLLLGGCYYTVQHTEGTKVTSPQIQEIRLGKTTEMDLLKLLGSPAKKERTLSGTEKLLYHHRQVKSLTFPGGLVAEGLLDREEDESFEIILKEGRVQSYRFVPPNEE